MMQQATGSLLASCAAHRGRLRGLPALLVPLLAVVLVHRGRGDRLGPLERSALFELALLEIDILDTLWLDVTMKRIGVAELKNNLSKNLRLVEGGEVIEVTDHHRAIARLVPIETKSALMVRPAIRPFSEVSHLRWKLLDLPINSTELLRQDRDIR